MAEPSPGIANRVEVMRRMAENAHDQGEHFVYVRIPEPLGPFERGDKYEDPIETALARANLGEVTGGGQQLGERKTIAYCGIDVVLKDRARGLARSCDKPFVGWVPHRARSSRSSCPNSKNFRSMT